MFKPLIDSYSAVLKKFKGNDIGATINEEVNIERLKTMYDGYDGDRIIEIRFIDPRRFTAQQRNFIYALIGDIFIDTGMPTDFWKEFFYFRFEGVTGRKISLKDESNTTVSDANVLANIILDFIFEHHIPFKEGYEILPANQEYYFYKCITKRVCCICGKTGADIDHFDKALGRRKRKEVDHSEYTFAALCRIHHTEKHKIGVINFKNKYQIKGIKLNQETIKKLRIGGKKILSDNKRYYYLKLKENFFDSDEMVLLESMPDGYIYSNILLKLYLRSLKHEGKLMFNDRIPFNSTMLATITRHSVGVVEKAVQIFRDLQLIDVLDNGAIYMSDIQSFIGKSSTEADRKREYRKKIEEAKRNLITGGQVSDKCPDKTTPELEIEIEKDIERDIDKEEKKGKYSDEHLRLAKKLQSNLTEDFPKEMNKVDIEKWADIIRLMEERDKASIEAIEYVINWLPTNEFWFGNIRSAKKLREKFEKLKFEIKADKKNHKKQSQKLQYSNPSEYDDLPI